MKKILAFIISLLLLITSNTTFGYEEVDIEYYSESIEAFKNSPSVEDLSAIEDLEIRYCEQVYLEATRRREYTQNELDICGDLFEIKRQQEMDYMFYMLNNRYMY